MKGGTCNSTGLLAEGGSAQDPARHVAHPTEPLQSDASPCPTRRILQCYLAKS
ncbi:hypothetical protein MAPG_10726 [Magnaporthiopsis poae ATCC 64411]|uniref:Uncharacterized protein n=1 Tax=Magnaporthiopsis poae (strain ATCC 64411 / 73-15) TaxID=644358 RepID=A0A0C4EDD1_MAGP6|nr:hypothetical protein MAPG_10726 [Magnaporthiopsis poae ATCC 64411]